jgi:uncharacterized paraquat-inducible protein A
MLSTHTQIVFKFGYTELNVFQSAKLFFDSNEYFLAIIILLFTFLMPIVEFINLIVRIFSGKTNQFLQYLDKWNMLDVFLVALLLLNFKMQSNVMVMQLKIGTTFIALSVIFRILAAIFITNNNKE